MPTTATIGVDQELKTRAEEFSNAWNSHDARGLASFFKNDADVISPFGRIAKGRSEIEKLFHDEHTSFMKNTTSTFHFQNLRALTPDLTLSEWEQDLRNVDTGNPNLNNLRIHCTMLMERQDGTWYIVAARPVIYLREPGKK